MVNLSSVLKELGRFVEAEATLRQALRIAPDSPVLRYNWSLLMLLLGRVGEAGTDGSRDFAPGPFPGGPLTSPMAR